MIDVHDGLVICFGEEKKQKRENQRGRQRFRQGSHSTNREERLEDDDEVCEMLDDQRVVREIGLI